MLDSIYLQIATTELENALIKTSISFDNSSNLMESSFENYFYRKVKYNAEFVLNELIKFSYLKKFYQNQLYPIIKTDSLYKEKLNRLSTTYSIIEKTPTLKDFYNIVDFTSYERQKLHGKIHIDSISFPNKRTIQKALKGNEVLLITQKNGISDYFLTLSKVGMVKYFENTHLKKMLQLYNDKSFIIVDLSNSLSKFSSEYFNLIGKIPTVRFLTNINDILEKTEEVHLENLSLYGINQSFSFNHQPFSPLNAASTEIDIVQNNFNSSIFHNQTDSTMSFDSDITHLSGHFVQSNIHPIFNKIPIGQKDSTTYFFAGYDHYNTNIKSKLVVLNACKTGDSQSYDDISGQNTMARYLIDAGAKSVLVTNRKVFDKVSVLFMEQFYGFLSDKYSAMESLQQATIYIKENVSDDPKIWDAYQLFGDELQQVQDDSLSIYWLLVILMLIIIFSYSRRQTVLLK